VLLPNEVLIARLRNELKACSGYFRNAPDLSDPARIVFPIVIEIELNHVPAHFVNSGKCMVRYTHRFSVTIEADYPYRKPTVTWLTPIFHPNIMMPEDGGYLCTKLLQGWNFHSTLITFIKGVEGLVTSPNPSNPFGTDSCTAAAEYYNKGSNRLPPMIDVPLPRVVRHW
jgi:hypothetical protein